MSSRESRSRVLAGPDRQNFRQASSLPVRVADSAILFPRPKHSSLDLICLLFLARNHTESSVTVLLYCITLYRTCRLPTMAQTAVGRLFRQSTTSSVCQSMLRPSQVRSFGNKAGMQICFLSCYSVSHKRRLAQQSQLSLQHP